MNVLFAELRCCYTFFSGNPPLSIFPYGVVILPVEVNKSCLCCEVLFQLFFFLSVKNVLVYADISSI